MVPDSAAAWANRLEDRLSAAEQRGRRGRLFPEYVCVGPEAITGGNGAQLAGIAQAAGDRPDAAGKTAAPIQLAQTTELAEHLRAALADLDDRQAEVFCLACLEGCSYRQIASQLGLTISHVGVLLNRAKSGLRERLRAYAPNSVQPLEHEP